MPVSPDQGSNLARSTVALYLEAEQLLIRRIAELLERGLSAGNALAELAAARVLRQHVERVIASLTEASARSVADALARAADAGDAAAVTDLGDAGAQQATAAAQRLPGVSALASLTSETTGALRAAHERILPWALGVLRDVIAAAAGGVLLGTDTRVQAAQRALDALVAHGITGFVDSAGRGWDLASYVEMALRTATGRAAVDAHMDRLAGNGLDLVIISDSPRECPLCRPYEGKVLSISGTERGRVQAVNPATGRTVTVNVAGSLADARRRGLFHPNCRHSASAYMPGLTTPRGSSEPDGYKAQQRQRAIERHIRDWKRREAAALTPEARQLARAKVREWQAALRDHLATNPALKRQPHREQVGRAR